MAHYVAELMDAAAKAQLEARDAAERRCASAILELWDHRAELPGRRLPMDLGPVIAVLTRIDPAVPQPIYFFTAWREMERDAKHDTMAEPARKWLQIAEQVDQTARAAILFAVGKAAEAETDRAKPWVALAEAAGLDGSPDIALIRRLMRIGKHGEPENTVEIEDLKDKLARLAEFRRAAETIEAEWRTQLDAATAINAASTARDKVAAD